MPETVFERIAEVVQQVLGVTDSLTLETNLDDDLAVDALDRDLLLEELEEEFDICIAEESMEAAKTVGDLMKLVEYQL